ncbi:N-acetyltransferase [Nocardia cyriacigeorgica]|uniref:N-acetyltransferase n=1 Tax=Nocardia cyriacigeorgica TaxID=135487 RepID=A0A5R8PHD1_9NOCA|nr:GNAT family N-acetyltransferase [Nocardia cyriacigeorgica]TLG14858.1 N-acetyltransferase [Nocardia cyriacigeorgica]
MTESTVATTVADNHDKHRFEIFYGGELAGFAEYEERGDEIVFVHTEIDDAFGGKGLGTTLAHQAIQDVIARGKTIRPECPFIKSYLDKHSEYDEHVVGKGAGR